MSKGGFRKALQPWLQKIKERSRDYDNLIANTHLSQQWCEDRLKGVIHSSDPSWYSLPREIFSAENIARLNLPSQMVGDYLSVKGTWEKRYSRQDLRDAWRYGMIIADNHMQDGSLWPAPPDTLISLAPRPAWSRSSEAPSGGISGLHGDSFITRS